MEITDNVPSGDYVLKKDYELMTIGELESYIREHQHLPDVPSAEEFKKNGYKAGEMDDLLLRKIEELTLYIIEQEKKIEAFKQRINDNKKTNLYCTFRFSHPCFCLFATTRIID
ncbi:MAG: hypothetical protein U9Q98_02490 [Bacteroidota bacterium]|nr:hypothetical protein [Bacteroidota bacterium]